MREFFREIVHALESGESAELAVVGVLLFPAKGEEDADDPG